MTKPTDNKFLKQIVANIASKAEQGRITELNWGVLSEARKKKSVKEVSNMAPKKDKKPEVTDEPADEKPADDVAPAGAEDSAPKGEPDAGGAPDLGAGGGGGADLPPLDAKGDQDDIGGPTDDAEESPEDAQADAAKAKAELEKAKAEKDQAEKEIKKQSYVHLISSSGVHFLLAKLVDHAFKTNTIDGLASEMTNKLKIQTSEDFANFAEEMAPFRGIPGVAELLSAIKSMATKTPETEDKPVSEEFEGDDLDRELDEKIAKL